MKYKDPEPKQKIIRIVEGIVNLFIILLVLWLPIFACNFFETKGAVVSKNDRYTIAVFWYIIAGFVFWWANGKTFKDKKTYQNKDDW